MNNLCILLDPGHVRQTPGKRSPDGRLLEYQYNREILERIKNKLDELGIDNWNSHPELDFVNNKYKELKTAKEAFKKGKTASFLDIWFRPKWRFFRDYIIKAGFLDGYTGYQVCKMSAYITFSKYIKLREYSKQGKITK